MKTYASLNMLPVPHLYTSRLFMAVTILCLLLFAHISYASSHYYDVEVIIYEDADAKYLHAEQWDNVITPVDSIAANGQTVAKEKISQPGVATDKTAKLAENKKVAMIRNIKPYILTREEKRVAASSHYNVLMYAAWRQPGWDKTQALAIKLSELKNNAVVKTKNTIDGTLKVVLARYLHFYTNLDYQRKAMQVIKPDDNNINLDNKNQDESTDTNSNDNIGDTGISLQPVPVIQHYHIISHRRMRSKKLHYIDYPLVGILVQINPSPVAKNNQRTAK